MIHRTIHRFPLFLSPLFLPSYPVPLFPLPTLSLPHFLFFLFFIIKIFKIHRIIWWDLLLYEKIFIGKKISSLAGGWRLLLQQLPPIQQDNNAYSNNFMVGKIGQIGIFLQHRLMNQYFRIVIKIRKSFFRKAATNKVIANIPVHHIIPFHCYYHCYCCYHHYHYHYL